MPLVLTRKPGESILILTEHGSVEVTFCGTSKGAKNAKLLITAPLQVPIVRTELADAHAIEQRAFHELEKSRGV